ncbi:armadillo-type protein [Xylaria castorea]|nr:armadillo-type protein [Xylaria castorea]
MSGLINQLFDEIPGDDEEQQTKALRRVADLARDLWKTEPGSADLDLLAQRVGDAAREEPNRIPLGQSGLLEFFCSVVSAQGVRATLVVQCLRIIGNSSADTDENRARVVASGCLPSIVALLNDDSVLAFVVPVLFNISVDYEPAQKAIYQAGINPELVSLISGPRLEDAAPLLNYVCKLLGFVATQEPEANLVHPATPFALLSLADNQPSPVDAKEFLGQTSVALTYLSQEQFQQSFLETPSSINLILQTFSTACGDLDASLDGPEDEAQLKQVQTAFTATLADLSAHPLFASSCSLDGPEVATLQRWISTARIIPLQSAACLALGNMARSDERCSHLVQRRRIHEPLVAILLADRSNVVVVDDAGLLHSVLGFLKNLAIPAANKPILGDAGLFEAGALPRIWDLDLDTQKQTQTQTQTQQVQFDAVSLARLLLVGCPANVRRIICAASEEEEEEDATQQVRDSKLHSLIDLSARSDQEPTQMETARAITTVCRVLHSTTPAAKESSSQPPDIAIVVVEDQSSPRLDLDTFYANHSTIVDAMLRLGQQSKYPVLRSELLFALALMARTAAGAAAIARTAQQEKLIAFVAEVITGEKSTATTTEQTPNEIEHSSSVPSSLADIQNLVALEPQAPTTNTQKSTTTTRDVDRENALVLVAELLRRCSDALPADARRRFEDLLREGGERVMRERDSGE